MGRIVIGLLLGIFFLLLGSWRIKQEQHQGGVFLSLGSTTILLTLFAARTIYGFFTPLSALIIMFLSSAYVALASVKYKSRALSLVSLTLAGIAPLLTHSLSSDPTGLFIYLLVVVLGTLWIVALTSRTELTMAALILIALYSLPYLSSFYSLLEAKTVLIFAYAFVAIFFMANVLGIIKLKPKEILPDILVAAGNAALLLSWIIIVEQPEWQSLVITAWMMAFVAGAFLSYKLVKRKEPFYIYATAGIAMLAAATAVELKGASLTIAYTIECGLLVLLTRAIFKERQLTEWVSWLLAWPILLGVESTAAWRWKDGIMHQDFFVLLILSLMLLGLGLFFYNLSKKTPQEESPNIHPPLLTIGALYAYSLLWLSLQATLANENFAVMISLVVYTIIGLATYFIGVSLERKGLQLHGGILTCFVVARLLLVDVWAMQLEGRIITFSLIGVLLLSTAFLTKREQKKP